jgi:hypothetical protein
VRDEIEFKQQLRSAIQAKWMKLTENDVIEISDDMTKLTNKLAAAYDRDKNDFEEEIVEFQESRST